MYATHRVKDNNNNTIGFIVNQQFIPYTLIKNNINWIGNLTLQKNGIIRATKALPEIYYKNAVIKPTYKKLLKDNPFQRDIQNELKHWKTVRYKQVLQLGGPRQVGKTTELLKFAYSNYEYIIYVNLADDRFNFASVVESPSILWNIQEYCDRAYLPPYKNSRDTILIIDEIQTRKDIYNSIRTLRTSLECDIVITGSYLGIVFNKEGFFLPAGTITYEDMLTMSFKEFAKIFKLDKMLESIDLYGNSNKQDYEKLESIYRIYRQIGGYPEVVKRYIQTQSIEESQLVVSDLLRVFKEESRNYFTQEREVEIFESVYSSALEEMCREKRGTGQDNLEIIKKISKENTDLLVNKNEIANTITWLTYTGILSTCDIAINGDIKRIGKSRRLYFSDCGLVSYLAKKAIIDKSALEGILTETFVFCELKNLFKVNSLKRKVLGDNICFSIYEKNELDFMLVDLNNIIYGIEVKTTKGNPLSLKVFIDKHFINKGIVAKPTYGGHGNKFDTIPIYTVGCRFPYN